MTLWDRIEQVWGSAKAAPARTRAHFEIPAERVDDGERLGSPFEARHHYFRVYVNELYLADEREWFVSYDPMAFVATHYVYATEDVSAACVVGPSMLEGVERERVPTGTIFRNTPVTGLHPYQGKGLRLTVILSKLKHEDYAKRLLGVLESVSSALDPSTAFSVYAKMGGAILDGVEGLLGMSETQPVLGFQVSMDPDVGIPLEPAYFALLDRDEAEIDPERFVVRKSRLYEVDRDGAPQPYRESDFVLFSIRQATERSDQTRLPFYPLWLEVQELAAQHGDHFWQEAKANFNALKRSMLKSPDLTAPDYKRLREFYLGELAERRREVVMESDLSGDDPALDGAEADLQDVARRLDALE